MPSALPKTLLEAELSSSSRLAGSDMASPGGMFSTAGAGRTFRRVSKTSGSSVQFFSGNLTLNLMYMLPKSWCLGEGIPWPRTILTASGTPHQGGSQWRAIGRRVVEKIILATGEASMGLLLNLENNITSLDAWRLITLASELNLGAAADTLVDMDVEDLAIDGGLLSVALLALVLLLDDLTLAVTVRADSLESLDHGTHLAHHGLHSVTITASASLNGTLLSTNTFTLGADD
ncbi:hypothetical protein HG530_003464 [Fusarium avenaceum]|nr:hypothetical protein HG530_003464 [Fusarium avenaceum]